MRTIRTPRKGRPIDASTAAELRQQVETDGLQNVASDIGVSEPTLTRALACLDVYGATHGAIRGYLDRRSRSV